LEKKNVFCEKGVEVTCIDGNFLKYENLVLLDPVTEGKLNADPCKSGSQTLILWHSTPYRTKFFVLVPSTLYW